MDKTSGNKTTQPPQTNIEQPRPSIKKPGKFISINLLPTEVIKTKERTVRSSTAKLISLMVIIGIASIALLIFIVNLIQKTRLQSAESTMKQRETEVTNLKEVEDLAYSLKNRLENLDSLLSNPDQNVAKINTMFSLLQEKVKLLQLSIDEKGKVLLLADVPDVETLDLFFQALLNPELNDNRISQVKLENLNLSNEGTLQFTVSVNIR